MRPPMSPPFANYTFRTREDLIGENDNDASYDTDEERKKAEFENLKEEFPECYMHIPRGIPTICHCCQDPVVVRTENGRKILECETKQAGFVRHYCRWWDEAIVEELQDRNAEISELRAMVSRLQRIIQQRKK